MRTVIEGDLKRSGLYSNRQLLRMLLPYFKPFRWHFLGAFGLLLASSALTVSGPWLIKQAIDVNISQRDGAGLRQTVLLFVGVQLLNLVVIYSMQNWLEWVGQRMMANLRKGILRHLLELPMSFHDRHTPGQLLTRVESDTQALRMLFTTTAVVIVGDIFLFGGMFGVMGWVNWKLTLVTATILPVILGITWFFQRRIHPIFVEVRKRNSEVASQLAEFIQAVPILQAYQRQRWALSRFFGLNKDKYDTQIHGERYVVSWWNLVGLTETLAFALILGVGGYWTLAGLVTIGTLAMFIEYVRRFFEPLIRLSEQMTVIQRAFASAERIFKLLAEPKVIEDPAEPQPLTAVQQSITFENVWFRYAETGDWVLKNVSFTIPRGESWALVGPTGSGKTTTVGLLLRFYEPQQGRILIDGVDIRQFRQQDLRGLMGMVQQDIYLFPGTLGENLRLGNTASDEELAEAARNTRAERFIRKLPDGWNTHLAERGVNLSQGQRQQLSLMRAMLRQPDVVILDEATSAIDPATEAALVVATREALRDRTALVIAHRLSTIRDCDRILVLQHGEVIQQGTWEELTETEGLFRTMHELQFAEEAKTHEDVA